MISDTYVFIYFTSVSSTSSTKQLGQICLFDGSISSSRLSDKCTPYSEDIPKGLFWFYFIR